MTSMKTILSLAGALAALSLGAGTAQAGGSEGSIGIGSEFQLNGFGGFSGNYDLGQFHVGAFFGFEDDDGDDNTNIFLGGRFFYHLHSTAMSDFSVGGSVGIGMLGNDTSPVFIEPGVQLRAFITSNVALSITAGLSLGVGDADGVSLTGQPTGFGGVHYYFF
jgi:hypothetical protein